MFLVPEDELFVHQVTETFASVGQSDRSWTEKLWGTAYAPDGSLQATFGLGLYPNRGVIDAFAGVSRGVEQWTVRSSRELGRDGRTVVGPFGYEVLDPLHTTRVTLEPTPDVPVAFDLTITGEVPPGLEDRELKRSHDGRRIDSDIMRFHQMGTAAGWVEVDGVRTETGSTWLGARDRSWGVRYMIGAPPADLPRVRRDRNGSSLTIWSPMLCHRADGSRYGLFVYYHSEIAGGRTTTEVQGAVEHADGSYEYFADIRPELTFDPANRRLLGGTLHATMADGSSRPLTLAAQGQSGFHLGTGLYFSFDGQWHGQYRGPLEVAGEHIADCSDPETARRVHQIRDCVIAVEDPAGGGTGSGSMQTIAMGAHPGTNLTTEGNFF